MLTVHAGSNVNVTNVKNPPIKAVTNHFLLESYTPEGYMIEMVTDFSLNFQCALPCKTCLGDSNSVCETCFDTGKYLLVQGMCYTKCPAGFFLD